MPKAHARTPARSDELGRPVCASSTAGRASRGRLALGVRRATAMLTTARPWKTAPSSVCTSSDTRPSSEGPASRPRIPAGVEGSRGKGWVSPEERGFVGRNDHPDAIKPVPRCVSALYHFEVRACTTAKDRPPQQGIRKENVEAALLCRLLGQRQRQLRTHIECTTMASRMRCARKNHAFLHERFFSAQPKGHLNLISSSCPMHGYSCEDASHLPGWRLAHLLLIPIV
eukprot:1838431-Pleurochrysis_carterae.AAC.1